MADSRPLVCVLEDDNAVRDSIGWVLERNGFASRAFESPNAFLLSRELDQYDCLVLDVGLPGMSGLELLELLRARAYSKPVILIAAATDPTLEPRMRRAGASELLMKPIAPDLLLGALRKAIGTNSPVLAPLRT
jgi:FixJ family two-component response regulator